MKKALATALAVMMGVSLTACGGGSTGSSGNGADAKSDGVMTYAEYMAADLDSEVTIEAFVQDKQSWWDDKATVYTQDADGAYFLYNMECAEADYEKLTTGTKIKVTGYKSEWAGEVEIIEGKFEIEDGSYTAGAQNLTDSLGDEDALKAHMNEKVQFKGLTVEAIGQNDDGEDVAYFYNWDNSGAQGDDVYFAASLNGTTYTFTIESYLRDSSTEVYKTAEGLQIGDTIDVEGFLYWYEGPNPQITEITVK